MPRIPYKRKPRQRPNTPKGTLGHLSGAKIRDVYQASNWWDSWIEVVDNEGNIYRLRADELLPALKKVKFKTEKKIEHTWLTI